MTQTEQKAAAKTFVENWTPRGKEKSETQNYWIDLLRSVYGVEAPEKIIEFEKPVQLEHRSFIDAYIANTSILIEQKSIDVDLRKGYLQSDGSFLTPYQQAHRYAAKLPRSEFPKWIIVCNFKSFLVYDMEKPNSEPEEILLKNLEKEYYRLSFIADTGNVHLKKELELSVQAGKIVGKLYEALLQQYHDHENPSAETLHSLNMLCVRLVFCLYAEDAGIFGHKSMFGDYLNHYAPEDLREALINLFQVLDQNPQKNERDPYLKPELAAFPYVNGGLFTKEDKTIPLFTAEIKDLLVNKASDDFNWSEISPTIFGAIFESTLNQETRRKGGMHYTSIENIHKVIDPLFLDELTAEYEKIAAIKQEKTRTEKAITFQKKLGSLTFFDPACGSGNFLTESYLSLRKLENKCLKLRFFKQKELDVQIDTIFVHIHQFYGIEINDFAAVVAKTALWIAESQMFEETQMILESHDSFLPLADYKNIIEGNALTIDWKQIINTTSADSNTTHFDYIMGNPPFVGFTFMTAEQKTDMEIIFPKTKNLDFVCAWYKKANDYIKGIRTECAFVSTNSITQGETVPVFWKFLDIKINFAYKTFRWDSESTSKAHVHCVIIGFSDFERKEKFLFDGNSKKSVKNINAYLTDSENIIVESRNSPVCNVPKMIYGNKPADGGYLIIEDDEFDEFVKKEPSAIKFIHPLLGAAEYLNNKKRYCLWLVDANPSELKKMPLVMERIKKCRENRLSSIAAGIRKFAETPTLFAQITQPANQDYIIVPRVSSEKRRYIPIGFMSSDVIASDACQIIPNATLYHFGILTSNVHNAWMRAVCGRLKSDYRYSKDIVYNNFPWCNPTVEQKEKIQKTAQAILDARAKYPDSSLADLYDVTVMPADLRKAHQENDKAVMQAYGFSIKLTESECVAELFKMYKALTKSK